MSETLEEIKYGFYMQRRIDFLRDMYYSDLVNLLPEEEKAKGRDSISKEEIIEIIIENDLDKQINDEA